MARRFGLRRRRETAGPAVDDARGDARPVLALDVDGVVSLFGFEVEPPASAGAVFELIGGKVHCIATASGERLRLLGEHYELIWASGWEAQTAQLADLLDLPELPYLSFGKEAEFGSAHWKIGPIGDYAAGRALAWIDDSFDARCFEWARGRSEPTLLVEAESGTGLLDIHVEALIGWARSLRGEPGGDGG